MTNAIAVMERTAQAQVTWSVDEAGVATVHMADADGRNALSESFVNELETALLEASADERSKVIVLTGNSNVFCSGANKELLAGLVDGSLSPSEILLPRMVFNIPLPIVAAMEGHGVGGGFALGLCADIVVIARESRYGCNFMELGITPGMGTTRLLEQVLTPAVARELLFTGEMRRGADFDTNAGFNYVLPKSEVLEKAYDVAARIAEKPRLALETLKRGLSIRRRQIFAETLEVESAMHRIVFSDEETRRRITAEYVE